MKKKSQYEKGTSMKKKIAILSLLSVTTVTTFTGCSLEFGSPKTATAVVEKYAEKESANYNVKGCMNVEIGGKAEGMSVEIPIDLDIDMDVFDEKAHGTLDVSLNFLDEELEYGLEMYVDGETCYTYDDEYEMWEVSETEEAFEQGISLDVSKFDGATLEVDKKAGTYTVSQPFGAFCEDDKVKDSFNDSFGEMFELFELDEDEVLDEFAEANVVYEFDKSYNLVSVSMEEFSFETEFEEEDVTGTLSVSMGFEFEFSEFGEIEEDDVKVPKSVKKEAVETDDSIIDLDSGEDDFEDFDDTDDMDDTDNTDDKEEDSDVELIVSDGSDTYGAYNGVSLIAGANNWNETFGADGWEFDDEDGQYSFLWCINEQYDGADLYVYNKEGDGTTRDDILNDGFYGYDIDVSCSREKPDMTFRGLTWGASEDDIRMIYGEPDYYSSSKTSTYIEYEEDDICMTFMLFEGDGMQSVSVRMN